MIKYILFITFISSSVFSLEKSEVLQFVIAEKDSVEFILDVESPEISEHDYYLYGYYDAMFNVEQFINNTNLANRITENIFPEELD
tara:strand:- start:2890 stop:3147 length:258 start_codon:yes stop_codon:yes gene_type:complete